MHTHPPKVGSRHSIPSGKNWVSDITPSLQKTVAVGAPSKAQACHTVGYRISFHCCPVNITKEEYTARRKALLDTL
jgi:hypothetical protein